MKTLFTLSCFFCLCTTYLFAQNTTVKPDKACINCATDEPTDGAVLEIQSSDKGILIPRMNTANRTGITNLADGLLVYDTDTKSFWYYNATQWTELTLNTDDQSLAEVLALGADANGLAIINLADPSNPQDAATKAYVDANDAVDDADADPNNEIQDLELSGNTLSLSNDATTVDLSPFENNWTLDGSDVYRNSGDVGIGTTDPEAALDIRGDTKIEGAINLIAAQGDSSLFIGANAGLNDDGTNNQNTFIGTNAGKTNTSGSDNSFWGYGAGVDNTIGRNNTFLGFQSGFFNTSGFYNTFLGFQSGASSTNDTRNTFIGSLADQLTAANALDRAIAIGYNAKVDCSNCAVIGGTGIDAVNVGIGTNSPESKMDVRGDTKIEGAINLIAAQADSSLFIGANAGMNDDGSNNQNTFIGTNAGKNNTTGTWNTFSGYESGSSNIGGNYNTFLGDRSGTSNTQGNSNTFLGFRSGLLNTSGSFNTFSGYQSGASNETGSQNTFSGYLAGSANTTGSSNTLLGYLSGRFSTTANENTFLGNLSGYLTTEGGRNTFLGTESGYSNDLGNSNAFLGYKSGYANTSGSGNTILGYLSGESNTTGGQNTYIGLQAGRNSTNDTRNTFIGSYADQLTPSSLLDRAIAIGYNAKVNCSNCAVIGGTGIDTVRVGIGITNPTERLEVDGNVKATKFIGDGSMLTGISTGLWTESAQDIYNNNIGGRVGIGTSSPDALLHISSPITSDSTGLKITQTGNNSLMYHNGMGGLVIRKASQVDQLVLDGSGNVGIGTAAPDGKLDVMGNARIEGKLNLIAVPTDSSLFIGANAGMNDDGTDNQNMFIGNNAGKQNTSGFFNTFLGYNSGSSNTTGIRNTMLGHNAGNTNTSGSSNAFFGFNTGPANTTGGFNTFIGRSSGFSNTTGGTNTFVGAQAGFFHDTGEENTYIGSEAGVNSTNDTRNTYIGVLSGQLNPSDSLDRSIAIGYNAKVNCSNCAIIGGTGLDAVNVGIGTPNPAAGLHVVSGTDVNSFSGGFLITGNLGGQNIGFDNNEIQARNNGVPSKLLLQSEGGNIALGIAPPDALLGIGSNQVSANPLLNVRNTASNTITDNIAVLESTDYTSLKLIGAGNPSIKFVDAGSGAANESDFQIMLNSSGRLQIRNAENADDEFATSTLIAEFSHPSYAVQFEVIGDALAQGMWINSDQRLKKDIQPLTNSLDKLMKLKAKHYKFDFDNEKLAYLNLSEREQIGLIAQELEQVFPELVITQDEAIEVDKGELEDKRDERLPQLKAVNYIGLIPVLIDGIQQQQQQLDVKQQQIQELESKNESLEARINKLESMMEQLIGSSSPASSHNLDIEINDAQLYQNQPNPFDGSTVIKYYIPKNVNQALIRIADQNGRIIKRIPIQDNGKGQLTLQANLLSAGTYSYSLILDGRIIETKQMVLTH